MAPGAELEGTAAGTVRKERSALPEAPAPHPRPGVGRRPATSRAGIEHVALELFARQGFEATTVDDIANAAGIGRRTFFRYYASKNDVPWGEFDATLQRMRGLLAALPADLPPLEALRTAVLDFNRLDPAEEPWHRQRMALILRVPALQAHSMLKYRAWREVVAEFAAQRYGRPVTDRLPRTVGWAALGVAIAAYEAWLDSEDADLPALLDAGFRALAAGFPGDGTRALLSAERADVVARLAAAQSDVDRLIGAGQDVATDDEHDPEGVGLAVERAHAVAALERAREHLARIDEAESRLAQGDYGRCTGCGRPIPDERLQALPTTTTCLDCSRPRRRSTGRTR